MREHRLERQQWVPAGLPEVFAFFSEANNLETITPAWLRFRVLTPGPIPMARGVRIDYQLQLVGLPVSWRTRIASWDPPAGFVDVQERGPYTFWEHTHRFVALAGGVLMTDVVRYRLPLGPIGALAHGLAVRAALAAIFDYRFQRIRELFGASDPESKPSS